MDTLAITADLEFIVKAMTEQGITAEQALATYPINSNESGCNSYACYLRGTDCHGETETCE